MVNKGDKLIARVNFGVTEGGRMSVASKEGEHTRHPRFFEKDAQYTVLKIDKPSATAMYEVYVECETPKGTTSYVVFIEDEINQYFRKTIAGVPI